MRLPPETFDLPISELRIGYRSAAYFNRSRTILNNELPEQVVTVQVFQKADAVVCGLDEAISVLRVAAGHWHSPLLAEKCFEKYLANRQLARMHRITDPLKAGEYARIAHEHEADLDRLWVSAFDQLEIEALHDGDDIRPWEPVMHITGPLRFFVHLESVYLGILARRTKVASNVRAVSRETHGKPLLFFADRFDHFSNQGGDGYAASLGGATGVATDAMGRWWGEKGIGTMPHALIAAFSGDTPAATAAYARNFPESDLIALVDFSNDCVGEAEACLAEVGDRLWGVRLDTSENLVDRCITERDMGQERPTGVNPMLVNKVRAALDRRGGEHVKIIVSGGFNAQKVREFETRGVPVDAYAVGSSLLQGCFDFTADVVLPVAKAGRSYKALR